MPTRRTRTLLAAAAGLSLALSPELTRAQPAQGQQPPAPPPGISLRPDNAALVHYSVSLRTPPDLAAAVRAWTGGDDTSSVPPGLAGDLEELQGIVGELIFASSIEHADFGARWEQGWATLLPYLGMIRDHARLLAADATRLAPTDPDAAAERLAALVRIAGHMRSGEVLIGKLVGYATLALAVERIIAIEQSHGFGPDARAALDRALDTIDLDDPLKTSDALRIEAWMASRTVLSRLGQDRPGQDRPGQDRPGQDRADGSRPGADLAETLGLGEPGPKRDRLARMTRRELLRELDKLNKGFERVQRLWARGAPPADYRRFERSVESGEFGLLAMILMPSMENISTSARRVADQIRDAKRAVGGD